MVYEMTSQDVKTEFHPLRDPFMSSSREEINVSEVLERWVLSFRGKPFKTPLFAIPNLSPILQIDYSSSIYRFLESKSETALTEEFFRKVEQSEVLEEISKICDKLILKERVFRNINKVKLLESISEILNEINPGKLDISEEELTKRVRGILAIEAMSGILNDLTPEQMKGFNEAVKRRPLFK